jgi:hypothetical protein
MGHENPGAVVSIFVARASRRAASTVVSTFFSAVTAIRLGVQREIKALPPRPQRYGAVPKTTLTLALATGAASGPTTMVTIPPTPMGTRALI